MAQPKLSPPDIWLALIFGLSQDFEFVSCVENSHAKNNFVFRRNSHSCNSCFDWCIGFLNCTSIQWKYVSFIIMKMGTGQFAPFRWTDENLFDMHNSPFMMSDSKKQKSTKLPQNFLLLSLWKRNAKTLQPLKPMHVNQLSWWDQSSR